jgi:hypothetical protein
LQGDGRAARRIQKVGSQSQSASQSEPDSWIFLGLARPRLAVLADKKIESVGKDREVQ